MNNDKWLRELEREWIFHNSIHNCYYVDGPDSGVSICPAEFGNFRAFCNSRGFPVDFLVDGENDQISGQDSDDTNFRSPVADEELFHNVDMIKHDVEELVAEVITLRKAMQHMLDAIRAQSKASRAIADMLRDIEKNQAPVYKIRVDGPQGVHAVSTYLNALKRYDDLENKSREQRLDEAVRAPVEDDSIAHWLQEDINDL